MNKVFCFNVNISILHKSAAVNVMISYIKILFLYSALFIVKSCMLWHTTLSKHCSWFSVIKNLKICKSESVDMIFEEFISWCLPLSVSIGFIKFIRNSNRPIRWLSGNIHFTPWSSCGVSTFVYSGSMDISISYLEWFTHSILWGRLSGELWESACVCLNLKLPVCVW
jgi:hypothetical protein